jgi:hypothetical protein
MGGLSARHGWHVDYRDVSVAGGYDLAAKNAVGSLSIQWMSIYEAYAGPANILSIDKGSFTYIYDFADDSTWMCPDRERQSRLVAVSGFSCRPQNARDDGRLKGWLGKTTDRFGDTFDKGHFIAHSIGGQVDQWEMNVFAQRRDLNRGWSIEGRRYTSMEKFCASNSGVLVFSRPIYEDTTDRPAELEFGVLKKDGVFWVDRFNNRWDCNS